MRGGLQTSVSKYRNSPLLSLITAFEMPQKLGHGHELSICEPVSDGGGGMASRSHQGQL